MAVMVGQKLTNATMASGQKAFPSGSQPPTAYVGRRNLTASFARRTSPSQCETAGILRSTFIGLTRPASSPRFWLLVSIPRNYRATNIPKAFSAAAVVVIALAWSHGGGRYYFVSRGCVQVIAQPRGHLKSDDGGARDRDSFDLIEWIARQPRCSGKVGMIGIGAFASEQFHVARQQSPHLAAIFPYDSRGAYGVLGGFREEYPGRVIPTFRYVGDHMSTAHTARGKPREPSPGREERRRTAMQNPDYKMYPFIHNVLVQKGQNFPRYFDTLIDPYEHEETVRQAEIDFEKINVPTHTGAAWYGYTYKTHLCGAQTYFQKIRGPKKLTLNGPAHLDRPLRALRSDMFRWYDHWLRDVDTGVMNEAPVRYYVMGANEWRIGNDWPLPETQWTKLYLNSWERLTTEPFTASSVDEFVPPDLFVQMPPTQTNRIEKLQYLSDPLPKIC